MLHITLFSIPIICQCYPHISNGGLGEGVGGKRGFPSEFTAEAKFKPGIVDS